MERSILPPAAADEMAATVSEPVPPSAPIAHYWQVFERLFAGTLGLVGASAANQRRHLQHAFYAGARAAFASTMDAFRELEADDPNGDVRLAAIEREVEGYFRDIAARAFISPTGRVDR